MLVDEAVLEKLDPSYKKEILKLESKYAAIKYKKFPRIKQLLFEFSQNYLMLPKYWDELFVASHKVVLTLYKSPSLKYFNGHNESVRGRMRSRKHFFSNDILQRTEHGFKKLLNEPPKLHQEFVEYNEIKKELCLPRKDLDKTWRYFKEYSSCPLPREALLLYEETEKLYEKIISAKNDVKKWFKLICQVKDNEYICNNVEYRIGNDMTNKELWKLYIKYLQKTDTKRLLYIYSCYCRFFLDDVKMKDDYEKACKKYGPSIVHWKNVFDFEVFKEEELSDEIVRKKKKGDEDEEKDRHLVSERDDNTTNRRFKFLAEHGNVETLHLTKINLVNEKSENVKLQEILSLTPKIIEFKLITITYFEPYGLAEFLKVSV
uniref:Uncharacterized protein n=1 Tax=Panagrolaimus davidi TaxID=227884 RepID=A0A914Q9A0_9BILA